MRVTFVGTGDAFGHGGRCHTSMRLDHPQGSLLVDFGASSIVSWRRLGFSFNEIDAILITHLHGDHFGGLPFLMLEAQFIDPRTKPLQIMGPPGLRDRLAAAMAILFPGSEQFAWRFAWSVREIAPGEAFSVVGLKGRTFEAIHDAGAPATSIRLVDEAGKVFAYSGDTAWNDNLIAVADSADLMVCECSTMTPRAPGHIDWARLSKNLPRFSAKRIILTHMGKDVLAALPTICAEGRVEAASDGLAIEI
jgi:ribonuclease BN (tRNA processing enzyme)